MTELLPCPFCGLAPRVIEETQGHDFQVFCVCEAEPSFSVHKADRERAILAWNTRPAPSSRMADVRLGAEAALKAVKECTERVECGDFQHGDSGYDIYEVGKLDPARIAATVTLPDAKGCEADRGIDWYAAYERMAHNRNELWAKLKAVEAALAHKEGK